MFAHAVARTALLLLFAAAALPGFSRSSAASTPSAGSADVRVIYWVDTTFGSVYKANIMLTNMTAQPIDDWSLAFDLDPAATGMRSASWAVNGNRHSVTGAGWTRKIPVGNSVWFSFDGTIPGDGSMTTAGDVPRPTNCSFNGQICSFEELNRPQPNPHDTLAVDVGWWVASQGVSEYRAQILLKNTSEIPVDHWKLRFQSTTLITDIEHANWSRNGANYELSGRGWTKSIDPDEIIWVTLRGVHAGQVDTLQSCIFNGFPCTFVDPDDFIEKPEEPEVPVGNMCSIADPDGQEGKLQLRQVTKFSGSSQYNTRIEIRNAGPGPVRDWEISFELPFAGMTVEELWPVAWSKSGKRITLSPMPWNVCLEPEEVLEVGFYGQHDGQANPPVNCKINGEDCDFGKLRLSTPTSVDAPAENPIDRFELGSAYPNPFSTRTTLPFRVEETQAVSVTLWDMQGRQAGSLWSGTAVGGQGYEISIPAGTMKSGVYMIRLTGASGAGVTTPVMLVR